MKYKLIFILLVSFKILFAEVSLNDCIESAVKNSLDLKIANLEVKNKLDEKKKNLFDFSPNISLLSKTSTSNNQTKLLSNGLDFSTQINLFDARFNNLKSSKYSLQQQILERDADYI